jgi:hypothetical protein
MDAAVSFNDSFDKTVAGQVWSKLSLNRHPTFAAFATEFSRAISVMTGQEITFPTDGASIKSHTTWSFDALHAMPLELVPAHELKENGDAVSCAATTHFAAKTNLPVFNLPAKEMSNLHRCTGALKEVAPPSNPTVSQQLADAATKGGTTETKGVEEKSQARSGSLTETKGG